MFRVRRCWIRPGVALDDGHVGPWPKPCRRDRPPAPVISRSAGYRPRTSRESPRPRPEASASRHRQDDCGAKDIDVSNFILPSHPSARRDNVGLVAIVKVLGMETEYGIIIRGAADPNPIAASSTLINAYVAELSRKVDWDFEDETPGATPGASPGRDRMPPEVETHLVNAVLTNGARYYVDHAHPEYSTPECANVLDAIRYDKAGELILARSVDRRRPHPAARAEPGGPEEQLRRQGQLLRHPRELPDGPVGALRPDRAARHAPLRVPADLHRGRQGRQRGGVDRRQSTSLPAHPAGRLLRGGGRPRDDPQAAHRQHPRRAPLRRPEVPAPARHRRRRQPVRGRQLPQGRDHRPGPVHDRGRLVRQGRRPRLHPAGAGAAPCARCPTTWR